MLKCKYFKDIIFICMIFYKINHKIYKFRPSLNFLNIWHAPHNHSVHTELSSLNINESFHAPFFTPLILADPIKLSELVMAPSNDLDGMTSDLFPSCVFVNAFLVIHQIFIDTQTYHHWTVYH